MQEEMGLWWAQEMMLKVSSRRDVVKASFALSSGTYYYKAIHLVLFFVVFSVSERYVNCHRGGPCATGKSPQSEWHTRTGVSALCIHAAVNSPQILSLGANKSIIC